MIPTLMMMGAGTSGYIANAVNFNGSTTYLARGAGLTGAVDGKQGASSFWVRNGEDARDHRIMSSFKSPHFPMRIFLTTTNGMQWLGRDFTTNRLNINSSTDSVQVADGWVHCMASWDLTDTGKRHIYINDVSDLTVVTYTNNNIFYAGTEWTVGALTDATLKFKGDLADFWFDDNYVDLSIEANRRKFISASGKPVDLGDNGELPNGAPPLVFQSGDTDVWHTNLGTGGGFTENGALTTASTSPSD